MANFRNSYDHPCTRHTRRAKGFETVRALSTPCPHAGGRGGSTIWINEESVSRWNIWDILGCRVLDMAPFANLFSPPYPPFAFAGKS